MIVVEYNSKQSLMKNNYSLFVVLSLLILILGVCKGSAFKKGNHQDLTEEQRKLADQILREMSNEAYM